VVPSCDSTAWRSGPPLFWAYKKPSTAMETLRTHLPSLSRACLAVDRNPRSGDFVRRRCKPPQATASLSGALPRWDMHPCRRNLQDEAAVARNSMFPFAGVHQISWSSVQLRPPRSAATTPWDSWWDSEAIDTCIASYNHPYLPIACWPELPPYSSSPEWVPVTKTWWRRYLFAQHGILVLFSLLARPREPRSAAAVVNCLASGEPVTSPTLWLSPRWHGVLPGCWPTCLSLQLAAV
jgi:hypothetical protein